jgi:hypothetical protein
MDTPRNERERLKHKINEIEHEIKSLSPAQARDRLTEEVLNVRGEVDDLADRLKKTVDAAVADHEITTLERVNITAMMDQHQKAIEAERQAHEDELRQTQRNLFAICTAILFSTFGYMYYVFVDLGINSNDILIKLAGFGFTILQTLIALAVKGYIKKSRVYTFLSDLFRSLFNVKEDLPPESRDIVDRLNHDQDPRTRSGS